MAVESSIDEHDETSLLVLAQAGDAEAFGQLYDRHSAMIYRYLFSKTSTRCVAEDLTSETFLRALRGLAGLSPEDTTFGAWLITIARNLVNDHYRSGWTRLAIVTDEIEPQADQRPGPEQLAVTALTASAVRATIRELPADQRECLILRFFSGLSISETAQVLGRSEGAVKQLQWRGTRRLHSLMTDQATLPNRHGNPTA